MNIAAIGVGSNIDPEIHIDKAKEFIQGDHRLLKESSRLKTEPVGFKNQADFINCAFLVETDFEFDPFGAYLKAIESKLGRIRGENKFGPRTIDLDIVIWNAKIIDADFFSRAFLKQSILEILPDLKI